MTSQQDLSKLRAIAEALPIARDVFRSLCKHQVRLDMDLRRRRQLLVRDGVYVKPSDYYDVFKRLQKDGFGKIEVPDNRKPARFKWDSKKWSGSTLASLFREFGPANKTTPKASIQGGRAFSFPWGDDIRELPLDGVSKEELENLRRTLSLFAAKL